MYKMTTGDYLSPLKDYQISLAFTVEVEFSIHITILIKGAESQIFDIYFLQ